MPPLETQTRDRVKEVIEDTFDTEGFTVSDDKLTRAAGMNGEAELAVYPELTSEDPDNVEHGVATVVLQLYCAYTAEPDETIVVDPGIIEGYADRIRTAFQSASGGNNPDLWWLRCVRIEFPDDPTGNKSRLEAIIEGHGQNRAGTPIGM